MGVLGFIVLFFALVFLNIIPGRRPTGSNINLTVWGVDDESAMNGAIGALSAKYSGAKVNYKHINSATYERDLIDALAAGSGPDVFMFNSQWLGKHINKIVSAPLSTISINQYRSLYPEVVFNDFVRDNKIYAFPLYVDTIAMYYNRNIFDRKSIALPPRTWDELKNLVSKKGLNVSLGGTTSSVTRASDIFNSLLLQATPSGQIVHLSGTEGLKALTLYTSFKSPKEESLSGFAGERIGAIFDYYSAAQTIKSKNPFLNFSVAPLPQFDPNAAATNASYYGLAVSNKSNQQAAAWEFISLATTNESIAESYMLSAKHPPVLRTLINKYSDSPDLGVFARQALIGRSWPEPDEKAVSQIIENMINGAVTTGKNIQQFLTEADSAIRQISFK